MGVDNEDTLGRDELTDSERGMERGQLLRRGALGLSAVLVSGAVADVALAGSADATRSTAIKRRVVWCTPNVGAWNNPIDLGFHEFAKSANWKYQKVGQADDNSAKVVQNILLTIQSKPDVLILTPTEPTTFDGAIQKALDKGIYVGFMTAFGNEPVAKKRWPEIGYVGADDYNAGVALGSAVAAGLKAKGRASGTVLSGNAAPGSTNLEARFKGIQDAFRAAGGGLKLSTFASDSKNPTQSAADWKVRIDQAGSKLAALAPIIADDAAIAVSVVKAAGKKPGQVPIWAIDIEPRMIANIKNGYVLGSIDGQFYLHGFLSAANAWAKLERGNYPPTRIETGGKLVTKQNVRAVEAKSKLQENLAKNAGLTG